jgi:hypothetical protein
VARDALSIKIFAPLTRSFTETAPLFFATTLVKLRADLIIASLSLINKTLFL